MQIDQLKLFAQIVEAKSFSKAAEELALPESGIAERILELENDFGFQLFINTPEQAILTESGARIIEAVNKVLRDLSDLTNEVAEIAGNSVSRLRIGSASAMFATEQLPEILQSLKLTFENALIEVSSGTSETLVKRILAGEIDIAFVSLPVESLAIKTELLFSDEIVAIAHPNHPLSKEKIISVAALAGEKLILGEKGGNTRRMIDDLFEKANVRPNVIMELARQESIVRMVENNMGVGLAGIKNIARKVRDKSLVSFYVEGAEINWNLGLATLRGGYVSPIAQAFVELCKANFAEKEQSFIAENSG